MSKAFKQTSQSASIRYFGAGVVGLNVWSCARHFRGSGLLLWLSGGRSCSVQRTQGQLSTNAKRVERDKREEIVLRDHRIVIPNKCTKKALMNAGPWWPPSRHSQDETSCQIESVAKVVMTK